METITLKGSTLISEPGIGILPRFQRFTCSEPEYYVHGQYSRGPTIGEIAYFLGGNLFQHR